LWARLKTSFQLSEIQLLLFKALDILLSQFCPVPYQTTPGSRIRVIRSSLRVEEMFNIKPQEKSTKIRRGALNHIQLQLGELMKLFCLKLRLERVLWRQKQHLVLVSLMGLTRDQNYFKVKAYIVEISSH